MRTTNPGRCVFCGNTGMTKQHIWPDWMKNVLPRAESTTTRHQINFDYPDSGAPFDKVALRPQLAFKQGHAGTLKIRRVCASCNGGWMSRLEQEAKPILTPLLLGHTKALNRQHQDIMSAWISMTVMIMDLDDPSNECIPFDQRAYTMENLEPPPRWRIWIGNYCGETWNYRFVHSAGCIIIPVNLPYQNITYKNNLQTTTLVAGNFLAHVRSTIVPQAKLDLSEQASNGLVEIWPNRKENLMWDDMPVLGDSEANLLPYDY
jgi:hypothetical protein